MRGDTILMMGLIAVTGVAAGLSLTRDKVEYVMAAVDADTPYIAVDDNFNVQAGQSEPLDVLKNDVNVSDNDFNKVLIVQQPFCGAVRRVQGELEYFDSANCSGRMSFTYCVIKGDSCPSARVTLSVAEATSRTSLNVGSETSSSPSGFNPGVARIRAPQLAAPNAVTGISATEATASLRQRPDGGIRLRSPNFTPSIGLGRPRIADISPSDTAAAIPLPRVAVSKNNSISPFIASSAPRVAAPRIAPSQLGGGSAIDTGSEQLASAGLGSSESGGGEIASRALRAVSSIFRPGGSTAPSRPSIGGDEAPRIASAPSAPSPAIVPPRAAQAIVGTAEPSAPALRPELRAADDNVVASLLPEDSATRVQPKPATVAQGTCDVTTLVTNSLGGTISFSAVSHCRPNMIATIEHQGLIFDLMTDENGRVAAEIPAMADRGSVSVTFADGTFDQVDLAALRLGRVSRLGITWDGDVDLFLSALEFGAAEGGEGHVLPSAPSSYREARRSGGGYLTTLGDGSGAMAQVYTIPQTSRTPVGTVAMSVSLRDGAESCGESIAFKVIRMEDDPFATERRAMIRVDQCGGEEIVNFSNVVKDFNFARR